MGMQEHEMNEKRLEDDNEASVFTFFVSCLFVGWLFWVGFFAVLCL
jgi:hypothetical protein